MKKYNKWVLNLMFFITNFAYSESWQGHWFNGATALKKNNFNQAIEEYTLAINFNEAPKLLYLERAQAYMKNAYFKSEDYKKAIQDLSVITDSQETSFIDKAYALWLRGQAHLMSGMHQEFVKDCHLLEKIDPFATQIRENKNYASFKVGHLIRVNKKVEETFVRWLINDQIIGSEDEMIFTATGMGILKKTKESKSLEKSLYTISTSK